MITRGFFLVAALFLVGSLFCVNQVIGHIPLNSPENLLVRDTLAVVSNYYEGLKIIDVSDPANPEQIWLYGEQDIHGYDIADTLLYIALPTRVKTYNISDPANPQYVMTNYNAACGKIQVYGDYYISTGDLSVYNRWTNENRLWHCNLDPYPGDQFVNDFIICDSLLYASVFNLGFMIFDFSNPEQPVLLSTVEVINGYSTNIALHDNILYYFTPNGLDEEVLLYDVSNPAEPELIVSYLWDVVADVAVSEQDNLLISYSIGYGIKIYGLVSPFDIPEICHFSIGNWSYAGYSDSCIQLQNGLIYISDNWGLRIIQPDFTAEPTLVNNVPAGLTYGLDCYGNYLYAAQTGLTVLSLAAPDLPQQVGAEPSIWDATYQVRATNGYALLRARYYDKENIGWIRYLNTENPQNPYLMGTWWWWYADILDMDLENNTLYAEADNNFIPVDISDPYDMTETGLYNNGTVQRFDVQGNFAYLCLSSGGVKIIDVTDPNQMFAVSQFPVQDNAFACQTNGSVLAVLTTSGQPQYVESLESSRVCLFDVSNPANPVPGAVISPRNHNYFSYRMRIYGHVLVLCDMLWNRIYLYDISDYTAPVLLREFVSNTNSAEAVYHGGYLYSADGHYGISVRDVSDVMADDDIMPPQANITLSCYPNPFTGILNCHVSGTLKSPARISVYNLKGQLVKTFTTDKVEFTWDGRNNNGRRCSPGLYVISLWNGKATANKKVILY